MTVLSTVTSSRVRVYRRAPQAEQQDLPDQQAYQHQGKTLRLYMLE